MTKGAKNIIKDGHIEINSFQKEAPIEDWIFFYDSHYWKNYKIVFENLKKAA